MHRRSLATFGLGATTGAALCAVLTTGVLGTAPADVSRTLERITRPEAAAAEALPAFDDCEELRQWYVDAALPHVGPWGFGDPLHMYDFAEAADGVRLDAGQSSPLTRDATGSSDTGTNVQEAGVDEPDIAKTDGEIVIRVVGRRGLEITDVSGAEARLLSRIRLPGRYQDVRELLLVGDTVLVVGRQGYGYPWAADFAGRIAPPVGSSSTHLYQVDVSFPGAPVVRSHQRIDGELVAAREYGDGTVRVVVSTGLPPLDFVEPHRSRTRKEAERINRQIVRDAAIGQWLPGIHRGDGQGRRQLLDCSEVRHPERPSGAGTISVLTFDIDDTADDSSPRATGITAAGNLVYSSTDRLYVATIRSGWWEPVPVDAGRSVPRRRPPSTEVHAFALDGTSTTYTASGLVPGTVKDRWSFDEHDGHLRVATALGHGWNPRENAITVLDEVDAELRAVGSVDGMGERERIQSVRWFGDLAVLVTFRQVDPLYTVDLSDPTAPEVLGELKIRGFSDYLHPVGDDLLLGIGQDATARGQNLGAQAAMFDLTDLEHVVRTDAVSFRRATSMPVGSDPRTFTYLPDLGVALAPVEDWHTGGSTLVAFAVGADGSLSRTLSWDVDRRWGAWRVRTLPLGGERVALVDRHVEILQVG
jgi:hypothetical protein